MGYRIHEKPKPHPHRALANITSPSLITINNWSTSHLAFPCWYQEVHKPLRARPHDHHRHDHEGWPSPTHPDHCCQHWLPIKHCCELGHRHECSPHCRHYIDLMGLHPIHLLSEGYRGIYAQVIEDGREVDQSLFPHEEWVDQDDDWIVRVSLQPALRIEDPTLFNLIVQAYTLNSHDRGQEDPSSENPLDSRVDTIVVAKLLVLPTLGITGEN